MNIPFVIPVYHFELPGSLPENVTLIVIRKPNTKHRPAVLHLGLITPDSGTFETGNAGRKVPIVTHPEEGGKVPVRVMGT